MQPPWCLHLYRSALPCLCLRGLCKAECKSHPSCRGVVQHLWGPPQLLCETWNQEHLLHCCSSAIITSRQGMQSPHLAGCCPPQPPFLAGKALHVFLEIWYNSSTLDWSSGCAESDGLARIWTKPSLGCVPPGHTCFMYDCSFLVLLMTISPKCHTDNEPISYPVEVFFCSVHELITYRTGFWSQKMQVRDHQLSAEHQRRFSLWSSLKNPDV